MSANAELRQGVMLGFGDVIRPAYAFFPDGQLEWGRLSVVSGPATEGNPDMGISFGHIVNLPTGPDGINVPKPGEEVTYLPSLEFLGGTATRFIAVQVIGTLEFDELKKYLARGWRHSPNPNIWQNIFFPEGVSRASRDPQLYTFLADLSLVDNPEMYTPPQM